MGQRGERNARRAEEGTHDSGSLDDDGSLGGSLVEPLGYQDEDDGHEHVEDTGKQLQRKEEKDQVSVRRENETRRKKRSESE